jgi:hypothetical protein
MTTNEFPDAVLINDNGYFFTGPAKSHTLDADGLGTYERLGGGVPKTVILDIDDARWYAHPIVRPNAYDV